MHGKAKFRAPVLGRAYLPTGHTSFAFSLLYFFVMYASIASTTRRDTSRPRRLFWLRYDVAEAKTPSRVVRPQSSTATRPGLNFDAVVEKRSATWDLD
jgi:hypothetical protein